MTTLSSSDASGPDQSESSATENSKPNHSKRRRRKDVPKSLHSLKEASSAQAKKDYIIPKACFARIVREIMQDTSMTVNKISFAAMQCLHECTEVFLMQRFQDAYLLSIHKGRVTLTAPDMQLLNYLKPI